MAGDDAAEYSRDIDLAVLATDSALHFNVPETDGANVRVDVMSRMRGGDGFHELWNRRTSVTLRTSDENGSASVTIELLALEDLVQAKRTQRDKDWPDSCAGSSKRFATRRGGASLA